MNIQGFTPAITGPVLAANANAVTGKASTPSTGSTTPTGDSSTSLQETFLNLLTTELQNQDPTAPVDPTAMVGQLVSLNQLDQLISINQTLSSMTPASSTATGNASPQAAEPVGGPTANAVSSNPGAAAAAALNQMQPTNTSATNAASIMNLYGSVSAAPQF